MTNCKHTNLISNYPGIWKWGLSWECEECHQHFLCSCFTKSVDVLIKKSKETFFDNKYSEDKDLSEHYQKQALSDFATNFSPNYILALSKIKIFEFYYHGDQAMERMIEDNGEIAVKWFKSFLLKPNIEYLPNVCHVCTNKSSDHYYCGSPYGSIIKQRYGAYIQKQMYQWGFFWNKNDARLIPPDILNEYFHEIELNPKVGSLHYIEEEYDKVEKDYKTFMTLIESLPQDNSGILLKIAQHIKDYIWTISKEETQILKQKSDRDKAIKALERKLENEIRDKLGYYKIGKKFLNETNLFKLVEKLYPECTIIHHYRPSWLYGQELDIYIKELNIGIEYQGEQHYKSIDFFGGDTGLKATQERDKRKVRICEEEQVPLIFFHFDETITEKLVAERIDQIVAL